MSLTLARLAADAVLYEGYLLYPYRSSARKNQVRWQFGVLGPAGAAAAGVGEEPDLAVQCLLRPSTGGDPRVRLLLRFLQLQRRSAQQAEPDGSYVTVEQLEAGGESWTSWDEAVEQEVELGPYDVGTGAADDVRVDGGGDVEPVGGADAGGRLLRERWPLAARVAVSSEPDGGLLRLTVRVANAANATARGQHAAKDAALRHSLISVHLLLVAEDGVFCSVIDPPPDAVAAAARCTQHRCWPVLAGEAGEGQESDVVLASPIILYDHPAVAPQSQGALFDSTEIDEILTLRVMTMTDAEKAEARATDPAAAAIIDRCDQMTPQQLQRLHGVLRDPHAGTATLTGDDWWQAEAAAEVSPETDSVLVAGVRLTGGSQVTLRPSRRADAHDMFYAGQVATVTAVHRDLDGETHVQVVLRDDPAGELHDWYGRYLHFAPDELEPLQPPEDREEDRT